MLRNPPFSILTLLQFHGAPCVYELPFMVEAGLVPLLLQLHRRLQQMLVSPQKLQRWMEFWRLEAPSSNRCYFGEEFSVKSFPRSGKRSELWRLLEGFRVPRGDWHWQSKRCGSQFLSRIAVSVVVSEILVNHCSCFLVFDIILTIEVRALNLVFVCVVFFSCRNIVSKDSQKLQLQQRVLGKGLILLQLYFYVNIAQNVFTFNFMTSSIISKL